MQSPDMPTQSSPLESLPTQYGYQLYAGLILVAVALIVYGLFWKTMTPQRKRMATIGAALLCAMLAVFMQTRIDAHRGFIADQEKRNDEKFKKIAKEKGREAALKMQYMYMPTTNAMRVITLNNPGIAADYVWLTSLQYVSNSFRRGEKFDMLARFFHTLVDLDPKWIGAEINGGKVLSALIEDRDKSYECYKYAIDANLANPQVWRLRYEAGMLYIMPPNDPKKMAEFSRKSAKYFDEAMVEKSFPEDLKKVVADRIARLRLESGSSFYQEAEEIMAANATSPESPESLREISKRDWMKAHSMALAATLTDEAAKYKTEKGEFPPSLEAIIKRFAKPEAFAMDAYGFPFDYNPKTGEATSRGTKALHAIQSGHVVNELITIFRNEHEGRAPKDLLELRDFVRTTDKPPLHPPAVMVIEAVGNAQAIASDSTESSKMDAQKHLDPSIGPLGPWTYDAQKAEIVFPPECDIKALYGHVNDYEWTPTGIVRKQ